MSTVEKTLAEFIDNIRTDVVNSLQTNGRYASGKTAKQLELITNGLNVALSAPKFIDALEYGRKPTKPGAPKGDPTVYELIKDWAAEKGIPEFATDDKGKEVNVWRAIASSIHKNGYKGKPGVLTVPLGDDNINIRLNHTLNELADMEANNVLNELGL